MADDINVEAAQGAQAIALPAEGKKGFKKVLSSCLDEVSSLQESAAAKIESLVAEEADDIDSMISVMDEADKTFDMMMDISERLAGGYDTIIKGL